MAIKKKRPLTLQELKEAHARHSPIAQMERDGAFDTTNLDAAAILTATFLIDWRLRVIETGEIVCADCDFPVHIRTGQRRLVIRCKRCGKGVAYSAPGHIGKQAATTTGEGGET